MNNELSPRDPKLNPKPGDRFLRWNQTVTVTKVNQGCVFTAPALTTDPRGWIGTLHFRRWAAEAEAAPAPRECAECKVREGHHWSGCSQFGLPPAPRECAECRILLSVIAGTGHAHDCSQFAGRTPVPYNADGFYRAPRVAAIAFAMKEAA